MSGSLLPQASSARRGCVDALVRTATKTVELPGDGVPLASLATDQLVLTGTPGAWTITEIFS